MTTELSNHGYMALGLHIGFKSGFRKQEFEAWGIDKEQALAEFREAGIAKGNRIDLKRAREVFKERFPHGLGSQTHMYAEELGYKKVS